MSSLERPAHATPPGTVLAAAILLYVGGGLTALAAVVGLARGPLLVSLIYLPLGALYLALGRAVQTGRPWARVAVLVLCGLGIAFALVRLVASGPAEALSGLAWPVVYAILVNTESARAWFRQDRPA
ncbi:hypothetical protein AB0J74_12570 [Asanoa sp. NPDC049573]|uniref:hypothetical protein n=1 Tax=Asanoa sp. NPDC049573 TaxID=3155396 RepID=UPI003428E9E8